MSVRSELEQFVAIIAHDLREPLNSATGLISLVSRLYGDKLDDQGKAWVKDAIECLGYMEAKVEDVLEYSRASKDATFKPFPLRSALEEAQRVLTRQVKEKQAVIVSDLENPATPLVMGDRSLIAQVFQNLLSNSIKYTREEPPQILIGARREGDEVCVSVRDNGLGFDMQYKDRIFGAFQRLYTTKEYPGTGMGLAIVKRIIDRHSGRIWVESKPGAGSTFYFTLPVANEQKGPTPS